MNAKQPAMEIEAEAADWLQRRHFWDWTDEDQAKLDLWLAQSVHHRVAYWRLKGNFARTDRLVALHQSAADVAEAAPRFRLLPLALRLAAATLAIALLGAGAATYLFKPQDRVFSTPVGGHETVTFADGSRIELNTDTLIRTRMTTEQRIVWLEKGEAFFRVKHDGAHPFMVMVGNRRVTDLGTEFLVRRGTKKFEVAVVQGRVWLEASDKQLPQQSALLKPGDVAVATAENVSVTRKSQFALATDLAWRHGLLIFDHTTLANAAATFNRYNSAKLVIADPSIASLTIDGTFRSNNVQLFARVVRTLLGLRVQTRGEDVVISR